MHTPFNVRPFARAASVRHFQRSVSVLLCAGLCCGALQAAPRNVSAGQPVPAGAPPSPPEQIGSSGGSGSAATSRRVAIGGVLVLGLWQAWRLHRSGPDSAAQGPAASTPAGGSTAPLTAPLPMPPVVVQATPPPAPPSAAPDPDRAIPMDAINPVGELDGLPPRILLDTLRELRGNKQFDCEHGRTSQAFLCAKIALIKAALRGHGVTWYGDESDDGCHCR